MPFPGGSPRHIPQRIQQEGAFATLTLAGDLVLTKRSSQHLTIDPDGSARNIDLPAQPSDGDWYSVRNSGGAETLTIRTSAGATVGTIGAGEYASVAYDGSSWGIYQSSATAGASGSSVHLVTSTGATPYSTIGDALAAASSGDVVEVPPGTFAESVSVPDGVFMRGSQTTRATVLSGADATSTRLSLTGSSGVVGLSVTGPSSGSNPTILMSGVGATSVLNANLNGGGGTGPMVRKEGAGLALIREVTHLSGNAGSTLEVTAGTLAVDYLIMAGGTTTDGVKVTGGSLIGSDFLFAGGYSCTDGLEISGGTAKVRGLATDSKATNALHVSADGVTLYVDASTIEGSTYDLLIDSLTGTGTKLRIGSDVTRSKTSGATATYRNVADVQVDYGTETGWAYYQDSTHTSGSPQALTANTAALFTIDGNGANSTEVARPGKGALWSTSKITPQAAEEAYTVRIDFVIQPAQTNAIVTLTVDIGSDPLGASSIPVVTRTYGLAKGTTAQPQSIGFPIFCRSTFLANGGTITIECDKNASVYSKGITIARIH